ncbi:MAG: WD40/YVTN/BNR-like repeat-containing protein [Burkholderiaceae bacterium]
MLQSTTSHVYVGSRDPNLGGILRCPTTGGEWVRLDNGLPSAVAVQAILIHPHMESTIFIGTAKGVYKSVDAGDHWTACEMPEESFDVWSLLIDPIDHNVMFAGTAPIGIYRSNDQGLTWQRMPQSRIPERVQFTPDRIARGTFYFRVMRIAFHPINHKRMYALTEINGLMRSDDGGRNWFDCNEGLVNMANQKHLQIKLASENEAEGMLDGHGMWVTPAAPDSVFLALRTGIFRSDDCGDTWAELPLRRDAPLSYAHDICGFSDIPQVLFAGLGEKAFGHQGGIIKSNDLGQSWQLLNTPHELHSTIMMMAVNPRNSLEVCAASQRGQILVSRDGGSEWCEYPLAVDYQFIYATACG